MRTVISSEHIRVESDVISVQIAPFGIAVGSVPVDADLILFMLDGDIAEQGTHEELLRKNGHYARLWNSQFEPSQEAG
jgi:hypothetical protein